RRGSSPASPAFFCIGTIWWTARSAEHVVERELHVLREAGEDRRHQLVVEGRGLVDLEGFLAVEGRDHHVDAGVICRPHELIDRRARLVLVRQALELDLQTLELGPRFRPDHQPGDETLLHAASPCAGASSPCFSSSIKESRRRNFWI